MSIFYRLKQRRDPNDSSKPLKWYAFVKSVNKCTLNDLSVRIARQSTIKEPDVYGVVTAFLKVIPEILSEGSIVDLGEFGTFRSSISSKGVVNKEEFTIRNIWRRKILFAPGRLLKQAMMKFNYKKMK